MESARMGNARHHPRRWLQPITRPPLRIPDPFLRRARTAHLLLRRQPRPMPKAARILRTQAVRSREARIYGSAAGVLDSPCSLLPRASRGVAPADAIDLAT